MYTSQQKLSTRQLADSIICWRWDRCARILWRPHIIMGLASINEWWWWWSYRLDSPVHEPGQFQFHHHLPHQQTINQHSEHTKHMHGPASNNKLAWRVKNKICLIVNEILRLYLSIARSTAHKSTEHTIQLNYHTIIMIIIIYRITLPSMHAQRLMLISSADIFRRLSQ